jgi:hypothetical protein
MNCSETARRARRTAGEKGVALIEIALALPVLIVFAMLILDFGALIHDRLIITNVSREGGSIASRISEVDTSLVRLLIESGHPLSLGGGNGRVFITRVQAGTDRNHATPTIVTQVSGGALNASSTIATRLANLGLPSPIYHHLVYNTAHQAPDIADLTVVEVFYQYRPITLLPRILRLMNDGNGVVVTSRALF